MEVEPTLMFEMYAFRYYVPHVFEHSLGWIQTCCRN
jgi:hypothetical protein